MQTGPAPRQTKCRIYCEHLAALSHIIKRVQSQKMILILTRAHFSLPDKLEPYQHEIVRVTNHSTLKFDLTKPLQKVEIDYLQKLLQNIKCVSILCICRSQPTNEEIKNARETIDAIRPYARVDLHMFQWQQQLFEFPENYAARLSSWQYAKPLLDNAPQVRYRMLNLHTD